MEFCKSCQRNMLRNTESGKVLYVCKCGEQKNGTKNDLRISGSSKAADATDLHSKQIRYAKYDVINSVVMKMCPNCGIKFMYQLSFGTNELVIYKCCGEGCEYESVGGVANM